MKLIDLMRVSNAGFYALEIYDNNGAHTTEDIDMNHDIDKMVIAKYTQAEIVRIEPIIFNSNDALALEVELYA